MIHLVTLLTRLQLHEAGSARKTIAAINFFEYLNRLVDLLFKTEKEYY